MAKAYANSFAEFNSSKLSNITEELPVTLVVSAMDGPDVVFVTFRMREEW